MWFMKPKKNRWTIFLIVLYSLLSGGSAYAVDKALLIATTAYADPIYDLPGLNYDIEEMERFARKLGFADENIKKLTGESVTLANIEFQFTDYLSDNVNESDRVFIYYSGHGLQVPDRSGDEDDRRDEALSMYDLAPAESGWDGVLIDDRFAELLRGLSSNHVVVVVDACHSGTVTRSFTVPSIVDTLAYGDNEYAVKALAYRGENTRSLSRSTGTVTDELPVGIVSISAAQDHQQSLASRKGSLFTLAIVAALETQREGATPKALMDVATEILRDSLDDENMFTPNLSGDERLFNNSIVISEAPKRDDVNWTDLLSLSESFSTLPVNTDRLSYVYEVPIELTVDIPFDGFINIVAVDAADEMVVLFPNGFDTNNQVFAGVQNFPGEREFLWPVQPPWGNTLVVALFSIMPFNLFESSNQRTRSGEATSDFVLPSLSAFDLFKKIENGAAAGSVIIKTCESDIGCN